MMKVLRSSAVCIWFRYFVLFSEARMGDRKDTKVHPNPNQQRKLIATNCPATPGETPFLFDPNIEYSLAVVSDPNQLCTLTLINADPETGKETFVPIGRSYANNDWEGVAPNALEFSCDPDTHTCTTRLPPLGADQQYRLTTFSRSVLSAEQEAARLLIQTTFGPTRDSISDFVNTYASDPAAFVASQMALEPTLHRAYYRQNCHARTEESFFVGRPRMPCEAGSRWRKFALTWEDHTLPLTVSSSSPYILSVDGNPRTQLIELADGSLPDPFYAGMQGKTCWFPVDGIGGRLSIRPDGESKCLIGENPEVIFDEDPYVFFGNTSTILLNLTGPTQLRSNNEILVHEDIIADDPPGSCHYSITDRKTDIFAQDISTGIWYLHDPMLVLRDNTPSSTLMDGGFISNSSARCASAPFNFLNDEFCVLSDDPNTCQEIVCPGDESEVANIPTSQVAFDMLGNDPAGDVTHGPVLDFEHQKWTIWVNIAMNSPDQLRQRVAWAFYQIQVMAGGLLDSVTEPYVSFYDIFVRNAFGNFRDILREVSYHPLMGESLSFLDSKSTEHVHRETGKFVFPDENYAREIMQLFSIGLWMLNEDGTLQVDLDGNPIPSYDMDDIMDGARAWTGFAYHPIRGNIESAWKLNRIDKMKINHNQRDHFPKKSVNGGGYIADGLPLCTDLPEKDWLRKGSTWRILGSSPTVDIIEPYSNWAGNGNPWIDLDPADPLYNIFSAASNPTPPTTVTLENNLDVASHVSIVGLEESVRVIKFNDIFYEYVGFPCVELSFYSNAKTIKDSPNGSFGMCASSDSVQASSCCRSGDTRSFPKLCSHPGERVKYETHEARCNSDGKISCTDITRIARNQCGPNMCCHFKMWQWTSSSCNVDVKITGEGKIAMVHVPQVVNHTWPVYPTYSEENRNFFRVNWLGGQFPSPSNGCTPCSVGPDNTCMCQTVEQTQHVYDENFINSDPQPSDLGAVALQLQIGSADPSIYDAGTYVVQKTWEDSQYSITFWQHASGSLQDMIIAVENGGKVKYFKNRVSVVRILDSHNEETTTYEFRNPPKFKANTKRDHYYETELVLDSYFYHPNTAPFISQRLIQRFGVSNPSPGYIKRVATAFRTGSYTSGTVEFGSSEYGDLNSTIAAIILDKEARYTVLDTDPTSGSIREPLLRVMHLMRSMEYISNGGVNDLIIFQDLDAEIGQMAHGHTSVFSFFLPEYASPGVVSTAGLVAPEAFIFDTNRNVGLMKGLFSLIKWGLTDCYDGFGHGGKHCQIRPEGDYSQGLGKLEFLPTSYNAQEMLDELNLLLTGGRLNDEIQNTILGAMSDGSITTDAQRLRLAQQLVVVSPEFHSTNNFVELDQEKSREPEGSTVHPAKRYKAIVYVIMGGGADTFNLLVPHSDCPNKDMYAEYANVRGDIAILKNDLLPINAGTNQSCSVFGVHPKLPFLQQLYNVGDASFFANTGVLHAPSTKRNYRQIQSRTRLFGHGQQQDVQKVDPDGDVFNSGVLGRITDILTDKGFLTASTSTGAGGAAGARAINSDPQKSPPATYFSGTFAPSPFDPIPSITTMRQLINRLNNATTLSSGLFAETWSDAVLKSLNDNDYFHELLNLVNLETYFPDSKIGNDLKLVSRMIKARNDRQVERDVFVVGYGSFDSHRDLKESHDRLFEQTNDALESFVSEMKNQDLWNDITLIATSEFGRTLTENGNSGTDHAWGGNYYMIGGNVAGAQIHGYYPDGLTESDPLILERGRVIPTTAWEAVWNGVAEWFGITDSQDLDKVLPNRGSQSHLFAGETLFKSLTDAPTNSPTELLSTESPTFSPIPEGNLVEGSVDFFNIEASGGHSRIETYRLSNPAVNFSAAYDEKDYIVSMGISNMPLKDVNDNDLGITLESFSFKIRVKGFRNANFYWCGEKYWCNTVNGGTPEQVHATLTDFGVYDGRVGRNGETISFRVEDIAVSVAGNPTFTASFDGFTRVWLTDGMYIFGEGIELEGRVLDKRGNAWFSPPYHFLQITVPSATERVKRLFGRFTVSGYV